MKTIIFDFDGVIINTYENHYQSYAKKYNNFTRERHKQLFEGNIHELKSKLKIKDPKIDISKLLEKHLLKQKISEDILEVLKKLKKEYLLCIITSHKEEILNKFFEKEELPILFNEILGVETHKKKSFKFQLLFEKYKFSSNECLFVTDTLGDILEANSIGVKSIAVDFGFHGEKILNRGKPLKIISDFSEILKYV